MQDGEQGTHPEGKEEEPRHSQRLRYDKPALRRLGSVNRLTLGVSNLIFHDGAGKTKATHGGG